MAEGENSNRFQVDLKGIIDILAHHLYSTPAVFVRELLQNGCDAIRMRQAIDPNHRGKITLELIEGETPTIVCTDNGIGLNKEEVHEFLSTVGRSSKRDDFFQARTEFIGQFGIGLLSCFTVSENLTLISRTAKGGDPAVKWTASNGGTYEVQELSDDLQPGASIYLRCRPGMGDYFQPETLERLARHWGALLPIPIELQIGSETIRINAQRPPWESSTQPSSAQLLSFGESLLGQNYFDAIPLTSDVGDVQGVAYVLPHMVSHARRQSHRVYLKGMLLSEDNDEILPDWAFFVQAVVNANSLRPTASRESMYADEILEQAKGTMGDCIRHYLVGLSKSNPEKLEKLISLHWFSLKALAAEDDEFFQLIIEWLPFDSTYGSISIRQMREAGADNVLYTETVDEYHQVASVASAQGLCVVNGGYTYDAQLLERANRLLDDFTAERLDASEMTQNFDELTMEERERVHQFLRWADLVLQPFKCVAEVRRFTPVDLPVFFLSNDAANFLKSVEQSQDVSNDLFSGVLDSLKQPALGSAYACVCFNLSNDQIAALIDVKNQAVIKRCVELLYIQALFLARQPLSRLEMNLLNQGIGEVIAWGVKVSQLTDSEG